MKNIFFLRHAKSDWGSPDLKDINRPLNKRGFRNAPEMGVRLSKLAIKPEALFVSPANRTNQTMDLLIPEAGWENAKRLTEHWIYGSSVADYLKFIETINEKYNSVLFCGHNPTITEIVGYLSGEYLQNMPTCAVAQIEFNVETWNLISHDSGKLMHYDFPKNVKK